MGTGSKAGGDTHEAPWGHSWPAKLQGLIGEGRQGGWWGEGGREGGGASVAACLHVTKPHAPSSPLTPGRMLRRRAAAPLYHALLLV